MGNIHVYNGQILVNGSGQIVAADADCCCQNGEQCGNCQTDTTPLRMQVTLANTDGADGTYSATQTEGDFCQFEYTFPTNPFGYAGTAYINVHILTTAPIRLQVTLFRGDGTNIQWEESTGQMPLADCSIFNQDVAYVSGGDGDETAHVTSL